MSYAKRTSAIRAAVDLDGADDGEAGERDELLQVGGVIGRSAGDTMLVPLNRVEPRLTGDELPAGAITIRPRQERITAAGAVELVRQQTRLTRKARRSRRGWRSGSTTALPASS